MHSYTVRSWENAEREYYLGEKKKYFVSILDNKRGRIPQFSKYIEKSRHHIIEHESWSRNARATLNNIQGLIDWKKTVPDDEHIVFHCTYGATRSPAYALASMLSDGMTPEEARDYLLNQKPLDNCYDNNLEIDRFILEMVDNHFELKGDLLFLEGLPYF